MSLRTPLHLPTKLFLDWAKCSVQLDTLGMIVLFPLCVYSHPPFFSSEIDIFSCSKLFACGVIFFFFWEHDYKTQK